MFGFISDIDAFMSLRDRFNKWRRGETPRSTVEQRFVRLFTEHGVARSQIPRFFGHDLTLADCEDDLALRSKLTPDMLEDAAVLFGIKVEWLEGATEELYEVHRYYKRPGSFAVFLDELVAKFGSDCLKGYLLACKQPDLHEISSLIVLEQQIEILGDVPINKYILIDPGCQFAYWKSRADTAACVAQCWKRKVWLYGRYKSEELITRIESGQYFVDSPSDQTELNGAHFEAEDLALVPVAFIDGVDQGNLGKRAAIGRWLDWHQLGLMDASVTADREQFEVLLNSIPAD